MWLGVLVVRRVPLCCWTIIDQRAVTWLKLVPLRSSARFLFLLLLPFRPPLLFSFLFFCIHLFIYFQCVCHFAVDNTDDPIPLPIAIPSMGVGFCATDDFRFSFRTGWNGRWRRDGRDRRRYSHATPLLPLFPRATKPVREIKTEKKSVLQLKVIGQSLHELGWKVWPEKKVNVKKGQVQLFAMETRGDRLSFSTLTFSRPQSISMKNRCSPVERNCCETRLCLAGFDFASGNSGRSS